ncbi:MAG: NAD(P)/FAD-dependent oxidoreductase [Gammaproteobacteria bacterium]|nr:NAD(P)/FAD-dependent oxidoreductase [Gammaproteobacteria bacterium]
MQEFEVAIVGGGPAGSTCAWRLRQAGVEVVVLDRESFPRTKLCAGWITPKVVADLELDITAYPHSFMTFQHINAHWWRTHVEFPCVQHSIRRWEFDQYLLERSGAPVHHHYVKHINQENGAYVIDDKFRCRYLVGAAGTKCPVYREFLRDANPRARALQTVTFEHEFAYDWSDSNCHLWFFGERLPGYSWYVPKANGHLNVGIGGMAGKLKRRGGDIRMHWQHLVERLDETAMVRNIDYQPAGYSYYLRGNVEVVRNANAFIIGDAAGLATRDLCEGIGPAVESGLLAADAIVNGSDYSLDGVTRYSGTGIVSKVLEQLFIGRSA